MNEINTIGVMPDGNRRWADKNDKSIKEAYERGTQKISDVIKWSLEKDIKELIIYAFSTENWDRGKDEINDIRKIIVNMGDDIKKMINTEKVGIKFIGDYERFGEEVKDVVKKIEKDVNTGKDKKLKVGICMSYGGRSDIIQAVNKFIKIGKEVDEKSFEKELMTYGFQDPDIIIRTGGNRRISNFLTWNSIYSELYFMDEYWPDFNKKKFEEILEDYKHTSIRKGS